MKTLAALFLLGVLSRYTPECREPLNSEWTELGISEGYRNGVLRPRDLFTECFSLVCGLTFSLAQIIKTFCSHAAADTSA